MNVQNWFIAGKRNTVLELPYTNWKDFRMTFNTLGAVPILIDFGDGVINTANALEQITYSLPAPISGVVKIYNANSLIAINSSRDALYRTDWNFGLEKFLICRNLQSIDFRSGNIYGDIVNVSPTLKTFQILSPSYGVLTGSAENFSPLLENLNITSTNCQYDFTENDVLNYFQNIRDFTISGKSRYVGSLNAFPTQTKTISLINSDGIRRHEVSYTAGRTWNTGLVRVQVRARDTFGLNTAMLDAILSDLADTTWNNNTFSVLELTQGHGQRTTSSNSDVATIQSYNVTVSLNPAI